MNLDYELKKFYDNQVDSLYEDEMKKLRNEFEKKNFISYYEKSLQILNEIDIDKLNEIYETFDSKLKKRIIEFDKIEEKLNCLTKTNIFPSNDQIAIMNNFNNFNITLSENLSFLNSSIENLENDYLDSIKKMKKTYENRENDSLIENLNKILKEKKIRLNELLKIRNDKERIFLEKSETLKTNTEKVSKFETEFEQTKEKYNFAYNSQQNLLEEIQKINENNNKYENEIISCESSLRIKTVERNIKYISSSFQIEKIKKFHKKVYKIGISEGEYLYNLKNEIDGLNKIYENTMMLYSEHESSYKKFLEKERIIKEFQYNNSKFVRLIFLYILLKNKIEKVYKLLLLRKLILTIIYVMSIIIKI